MIYVFIVIKSLQISKSSILLCTWKAKNQIIPAWIEASDRLHTSKDSNDKKLLQKMCQITILNLLKNFWYGTFGRWTYFLCNLFFNLKSQTKLSEDSLQSVRICAQMRKVGRWTYYLRLSHFYPETLCNLFFNPKSQTKLSEDALQSVRHCAQMREVGRWTYYLRLSHLYFETYSAIYFSTLNRRPNYRRTLCSQFDFVHRWEKFPGKCDTLCSKCEFVLTPFALGLITYLFIQMQCIDFKQRIIS